MSRTEDPGARSSTDEGFDWGIPIYDRISPDFINLARPVKLTAIRGTRTRDTGPSWRLALPPPDVASPPGRRRHFDAEDRRVASMAALRRARSRSHRRRRGAAAVGRPSHRRDL